MYKQTASLWNTLSYLGADTPDYRENRRIVLTNQIGILGFLIPQLYNIYYAVYDLKMLWPLILINVVGGLTCLSVLFLNRHHFRLLPKILITLVPNIQIFFLTYFLGTASGMHLLHIMMISFVLFLFSNESRTMLIINCTFPMVFYFYEFFFFTPDAVPISLPASHLLFLYVTLSMTVFVLVMVFFALFFREITHAENMLENEYQRSENLLLNILPEEISHRLKDNPNWVAENFQSVTILFADIVNFTETARNVAPDKLVEELNAIFSKFDHLAEKYGLEKIKTIGDAYMVAGGIPVKTDDHTEQVARMALDMLDEIKRHNFFGNQLNIRLGFHTGPVVAGVIGLKKFSYDIWGDAVNMASRLESSGEVGKIHVSADVHDILKHQFRFVYRGSVDMKGIGPTDTYYLTGPA